MTYRKVLLIRRLDMLATWIFQPALFNKRMEWNYYDKEYYCSKLQRRSR
jgi:hypothetical protein